MGATQFKQRNTGKTAAEAYRIACERAEDEYGHQEGYNGTISTTAGFRDETEAYKKSKFDDVSAYIYNRFENMNKYDCSAICLRQPIDNKNKTKSQVEHIVTPGTKKWVLKYVIYSDEGRKLGDYRTKGHAVNNARKYTEDKQISTYIIMEKQLEQGTNKVAKVTYKKAINERDGEWVFFGYAAE